MSIMKAQTNSKQNPDKKLNKSSLALVLTVLMLVTVACCLVRVAEACVTKEAALAEIKLLLSLEPNLTKDSFTLPTNTRSKNSTATSSG